MPKIKYQDIRFIRKSLTMIDQANEIITDFSSRGFNLTLRQLYYQFVARDLIPNRDSEYKKLGSVISDARLAGLIDWDHIQDRTRFLRGVPESGSIEDTVRAVGENYHVARWKRQPVRVEVWIEKDALVDVVAQACQPLDVDYFSCRGYTSQSEMWTAGRRHRYWRMYGEHKPRTVVLHLGDHDPSGIDMTRDIRDRLTLFSNGSTQVERIALTME